MADPVAKTIVEIGADITPLQQKLGEAKAQITAASQQMSAAGSGRGGGGSAGAVASSTGGGGATPGRPSNSDIAAQMKAAAEAVKTYVSNMSSATTPTVQVADGAKKTAENTKAAANESKFMSVGVAGMAGAVAGLGRALNELWKGIKGFGDGARAIANDLKNIESQFRSDITASLDPISKRTQEIENAKKAALDQLETERVSRGIIGDIVGLISDEAETKIKIQKIENEAAAAQERNREAAKKAAQAAALEEKKKEEELKQKQEQSAKEAANTARELYIQTLDERGQLEAKFNDDVDALEEKRNAAQTDAERASYEEAIAFRSQILEKDLKNIADKKAKEEEENQKSAKEKAESLAKEQRDFMKSQTEQIRSLRSEINNLFNSGNMEVGISRIGGLIQTLIDKTENIR